VGAYDVGLPSRAGQPLSREKRMATSEGVALAATTGQRRPRVDSRGSSCRRGMSRRRRDRGRNAGYSGEANGEELIDRGARTSRHGNGPSSGSDCQPVCRALLGTFQQLTFRGMTGPTIHDVANRAGVSKSSVSRVLGQSPFVSDRTRADVLRAIEELGYRPNGAARTLVRRRSNVIGVLVTDLRNPFFAEIIDGIEPIAEKRHYTLVVVSGKHHSPAEESVLQKLLELQADGIICDTAKLGREALREAARAAPIVILTRTPEVPRVDSVVTDDRAGAALAVEHLAGLGHRRIAMVADIQERAGADRMRGYQETMARLGLGGESVVVPGGFTHDGGFRGGRELLGGDRPPTAIFAANDFSALGVLDAASATGLDVPRDLSVVGYDDVSIAALQRIALTTVHQPARKIGEAAIDLLLQRIMQPNRPARRIIMEPILVERATTGPVRT
jgi:DNA-binding LacI/PurR family transcriptional regulator